ncbi:hypothetical protein ACVBEF_14635 [Glaciimonas sp. GG7]
MITNFQLILIGGAYDEINNPFFRETPRASNLLSASAIGCRWQTDGTWIVKFEGFPKKDWTPTISASPLPDHSGVVLVEIDYDFTRNNNAIIFNQDGSERIRLISPFGYFSSVYYENNQLGFYVVNDRDIERWYAYDVATNEFTRWHPVR